MGTESIIKEIETLMVQAQEFHKKGQHVLSLKQYQRAIEFAIPLRDPALMAMLFNGAGGEHRDCDNYHHAAELLMAALSLVPNDEETGELRAGIKKTLAITLVDIFGAEKPEILQLLLEAADEFAQLKNQGQVANVLLHIAGVNISLERLIEADKAIDEAMEKACAINDTQLQGWILNCMSEIETQRKEFGQALYYVRDAREKVKSVGDSEAEGGTWITESRIMRHLGDGKRSMVCAQRALDLFKWNRNLRRTIGALRQLAKVLADSGQLGDAVTYLEKAIRMANRLDLRCDQALLHLQLSDIDLSRNNFSAVREHVEHSRNLAESEGMLELQKAADDIMRRLERKEKGK